MRVLTLCIPCYHDTINVHSFIESCLIKEDSIHILFVTHGINESLQEDLDLLKKRYPEMIDLCDGNIDPITQAKGLYFKVMQPSHTLEQAGLVKVVNTLQDFIRIQANLDLLICDVEFKTNKKTKDIVEFRKLFPIDIPFEWHQVGHIKTAYHMPLESFVYKTNMLKQCSSSLSNTIYMSYAYSLLPLTNVKTMHYIDIVLEKSKRPTKQELFDEVTLGTDLIKEIIDKLDISDFKSRKMKRYVTEHFVAYLARLMLTYIQDGSVESLQAKEELWYYLKVHNYILYKQCKRSSLAKLVGMDNQFVLNTLKKAMENNK